MFVNVLFALAGVMLLTIAWFVLYDSTHFETAEYLIRDPKIRKECRAAVIADLHNKRYGRDNEILLEAIRRGRPDFVLIAGDILTAKPNADLKPATDFISALAGEYPVYYGMGNHEHRLQLYPEVYGDMAKDYEEALKKCGVEQLCNKRVVLEEYGITVTGLLIHERFYQRFHSVEMEKDYLTQLLGAADGSFYQIALAHHPDYFPEYAAWGADLVLSGHVHGGVVRIPFWNRGLISPAIRFFPKYDGGLFQEGESHMLLSRGLGSHTIPLRLFNPGDLIFLDLQPGGTSEKTLQKKKSASS